MKPETEIEIHIPNEETETHLRMSEWMDGCVN